MSEPIIELRQGDIGADPVPTEPSPVYTVGNRSITSVEELTAYMQELLNSSYGEFEDFCHSLIDYNDTLNPELETWLLAIGKKEELEAWRAGLLN